MPVIKCDSLLCLHNDQGRCGVTADTQIDIDKNGLCVDNSPVTKDEFLQIAGRERSKESAPDLLHPRTKKACKVHQKVKGIIGFSVLLLGCISIFLSIPGEFWVAIGALAILIYLVHCALSFIDNGFSTKTSPIGTKNGGSPAEHKRHECHTR